MEVEICLPAVSPRSQSQILPPAGKIPTKGAISARRSVKEGSWWEYVQASCDFEVECTVCGWRLVFVNCLVGVDGLLPGKVVQMFTIRVVVFSQRPL